MSDLEVRIEDILCEGAKLGLQACTIAQQLDVETVIKPEYQRAKEHFSKLKLGFLFLESKQRLLASLVKETGIEADLAILIKGKSKEELKNILADFNKKHEPIMEGLKEKRINDKEDTLAIHREIKELAQNIRTHIQALFKAWSDYETEQQNFIQTRDEQKLKAERDGWIAIWPAWQKIDELLQLSEASHADIDAQLQPDQQASIEKALEEAQKAVNQLNEKLASNSASSSTTTLEESNAGELPPQEQLMQAHTILEQQLRAITQWQQKCGELKANILELQTNPSDLDSTRNIPVVPEISGPSVSNMRTATRVLNNLAGCIILRKLKQKQSMSNNTVTDENSNLSNNQTSAAEEKEEEIKTVILRSQPQVDLFKIQAIQTVQKNVTDRPWLLLDFVSSDNKLTHVRLNGMLSSETVQQLQAARQHRLEMKEGLKSSNPSLNASNNDFFHVTNDVQEWEEIERQLLPLPYGVAAASQPIIQHAVHINQPDFIIRELPHQCKIE